MSIRTAVGASAVAWIGLALFVGCRGESGGPGPLARGDSLAELGRHREAHRAYERSLEDPATERPARERLAWLDSVAAIAVLPDDPELQTIRRTVSERVEAGEFPSMAIAVVQRGRVVWNEAFGLADRATRRPATPRTAYLVGSMSKSIMATGALTLVDRGLIELDDPVGPILARRGLAVHRYEADDRHIRLRHLLDMRAGLPHGWLSLPELAPPEPDEASRYFELMARSVFPPGEVYHYSNFSTSLPSAVIEGLTGAPFADYMRQHLFAPLGMSDAGVGAFDIDRAALATGYGGDGQPLAVGYQVAAGGAGFVASATDLVQYALFHLGELEEVETQVIRPSLLREQHAPPEAADSLFGLGWFLGRQQVSNGRVAGGSSWLSLIPEERLAVVCLANMTTSAADDVCGEIVAVLAPQVAEAGIGGYQRYVAMYENPYVADERTVGRWDGTVEINDGRRVPITLDFSEDGSASVRIADSDPVALEGLVLNTRNIFKARAAESMTLPTPLSEEPVETDVQFVLRLDGSRFYGYVAETFATAGGGYRLGSYASLTRRSPGRSPLPGS